MSQDKLKIMSYSYKKHYHSDTVLYRMIV